MVMIGDYLYDLATDKKKGIRHWPVKVLLAVLSLVYGILVRLLCFWQRLKPVRLDCRVVSIGNLTMGGTGKTPLTMLAAGFLADRGQKVAILSRGYKCGMTAADEPLLISRKLPGIKVLVDADRLRSGNRAVRELGMTAVVLDDGFQQWRLKKDLDIVTIDALEGFGNRRILPAGVLREPLSALRRADIFVITNTNLQPDTSQIRAVLERYNPKALVAEAQTVPVGLSRLSDSKAYPLAELKGKPLGLFCGIAKPQAFAQLAGKLGFDPVFSWSFGDHYSYTRSDLVVLCSTAAAAGAQALLTTEKDAARFDQSLLNSCSLPVYALAIEIRIAGNERSFYERLSALLPA